MIWIGTLSESMLIEAGDLAVGFVRGVLGRSVAIAAMLLLGYLMFDFQAGRHASEIRSSEGECSACREQAIKMEGVCSPGYLILRDPPAWLRAIGTLPRPISPEADRFERLREVRYLDLKNLKECEALLARFSLVGAGIFLLFTLVATPIVLLFRRRLR